jgi:hypothetical protein
MLAPRKPKPTTAALAHCAPAPRAPAAASPAPAAASAPRGPAPCAPGPQTLQRATSRKSAEEKERLRELEVLDCADLGSGLYTLSEYEFFKAYQVGGWVVLWVLARGAGTGVLVCIQGGFVGFVGEVAGE